MADLPTATERFINGILPENPVYRQLLGLCPTLAVTNSLMAALTMAGAVGFVLFCANVITSLIRGLNDSLHVPGPLGQFRGLEFVL